MAKEAPDISKNFKKDGSFDRPQSVFRNTISTKSGAQYPPEKGRYHLYVSYACPWAHRTLIVRKLKGLEDFISFSNVHYLMSMTTGWRFPTADESLPGENVTPDPLHPDVKHMQDLYFMVDPEYSGRFSVPVLWDKKTSTIVNNESSEIIRMLNAEFNSLLPEKYASVDLYPKDLQSEIDEANAWVYDNINNGVYKCGLARTQSAYDTAVSALFTHLDKAESHLAQSSKNGPYYFGTHLTEADVRLYVTIVRFDPVYVQHFKCNVRDIRSGYPAIHRWLRNLYWGNHDDVSGAGATAGAFKATTQFEHIKKHYMASHLMLNPAGIVAAGPVPDILGPDEEVRAVADALAKA